MSNPVSGGNKKNILICSLLKSLPNLPSVKTNTCTIFSIANKYCILHDLVHVRKDSGITKYSIVSNL